jgi:hypothetical protein
MTLTKTLEAASHAQQHGYQASLPRR